MKKIILPLFIILSYMNSTAQTRLTPGTLKGKHETFIVDTLSLIGFAPYIGVYSISNKYSAGIPNTEEQKKGRAIPINYRRDIHVDNDAIKAIIYAVLRDKLSALQTNQEEISPLFKFEPNGKITDIGFSLHANTLITLEEIEEIDRQLRDKIHVTFTGQEYSDYIAISYSSPVITF